MSALEELDKLIVSLDEASTKATVAADTSGDVAGGTTASAAVKTGGDAIDAVLASSPRTTSVRSLRNDDAMNRFRQELSDGLIRVDTVGKVLRLVNTILTYALASGA